MNENTNKRAVSYEDFAEASKLIATKAEVEAVKKQVEEIEVGGVNYATTKEILALFQEPAGIPGSPWGCRRR